MNRREGRKKPRDWELLASWLIVCACRLSGTGSSASTCRGRCQDLIQRTGWGSASTSLAWKRVYKVVRVCVLAGVYVCIWLTSLCAVYRFSQIDLHGVKLTHTTGCDTTCKEAMLLCVRTVCQNTKSALRHSYIFYECTSSISSSSSSQGPQQVCKHDVK